MTDDETPPSRLCITQSRCRLCQFELADNELVVADLSNGRVSCEFSFKQYLTTYTHDPDIEIHMCTSNNCMFRNRPTVCFHGSCYKFSLYSITSKFLAATNYTFSPLISERRRRTDYIQQALAIKLTGTDTWPRQLPLELWLIVAGFLVRECATITAQEQARRCEDVGDSVLDLTRPVYASYVRIEGRYYVDSVRNMAGISTDNRADNGLHLVLPDQTALKKEGQKNKYIDLLLAEDHIGIRQVFAISSKRCGQWCLAQPIAPGVWWRCISLKNAPSTLAVKTDGLKMRNIESMHNEPLDCLSWIKWQAPVPSSFTVLNLLTLERLRELPNEVRMRFFDCNTPEITGYSVLMNHARVAAILSHKQGEIPDASLFHALSGGRSVWMYMPINQGEYLTAICRRAGHLSLKTEVVGMTFSTSQGRTVVFGRYNNENVGFRRVMTLTRDPCRIYYNTLDSLARRHVIETVAFEQSAPGSVVAESDELPTLPVSISPCPYISSHKIWLHTSCSMLRVCKVYPCISRNVPYRPVIGMLLQYADGHRECVGQFRLDWATEPILVGDSDTLYLCGNTTKKLFSYVAKVTCQVPTSEAEGRWLEVAQTGTLEWWFTLRDSVLCYDGVRLN